MILSLFVAPLNANETETYLYEKLYSLQFIKSFEYVNKFYHKRDISGPVGTWQTFLTWSSDDDKKQVCLIYRIPSRNRAGELKIVDVPKGKKCDDFYFSKKDGLTGFNSLKFRIEGHQLLIEYSRKNEKTGRLILELFNKNQKKSFYYPLGKKVIFKQRKSVSPSKGEYQFNSANICHQANSKCQEIKKFSCNECQFGWFEVAGSNCKKIKTKLCGINRCGEKGWPACPRGHFFSNNIKENICYRESPFGICQTGLINYCDENHLLVCL